MRCSASRTVAKIRPLRNFFFVTVFDRGTRDNWYPFIDSTTRCRQYHNRRAVRVDVLICHTGLPCDARYIIGRAMLCCIFGITDVCGAFFGVCAIS